jgi:hypothetical protein
LLVKDQPNYVRDERTRAILLKTKTEVEAYRKKKELHNRVQSLENRVDVMERFIAYMQEMAGDKLILPGE